MKILYGISSFVWSGNFLKGLLFFDAMNADRRFRLLSVITTFLNRFFWRFIIVYFLCKVVTSRIV